MKHISLLIKPASSLCGYRCHYCFYEDVAANRAVKSCGIMQMDTVHAMLAALFAKKPRAVSFVFQGGEPLLAGRPVFEGFTAAVAVYNTDRAAVQYSIQTNGALVDPAFCDFFARHRFLVGLSLDGTKELHDLHRVDAQGEGTFSATMQAARLLKKSGVDFNILTVVTNENARYADKIYRFYRAQGFDHMQFIPCMDAFDGGREWLSPERMGAFLKKLYDCWMADIAKGHPAYIRQFENYLQRLCGHPAEDCSMNGRCGLYYVVEADGSLYPCDFYCLDAYRLGSVFDEDPFALSERHRQFLEESYQQAERCKTCRYLALCNGGCRRDRETADHLNRYCGAYYTFFEHAYDGLCRLAAALRQMPR